MTHHSALIIVCVLFLIVGVVVLDDYGISVDEVMQRGLGILAAEYVMGNNAIYLDSWTRNYGVAFELSLVFFERILGLEDSRSIYLSRHLLTHMFFLAGGFFCYLLAIRLFNNRLLACFALLLFLLHPRMYAHSFFNTKDIPFLSMFMIALFLIDRGFRKGTAGAFLLCGVGVGLLTNIRILGVMLFAAVLAMRACDLFHASGRQERKHILMTTRWFALAGVLTLYATWPYLWSDPVGHVIDSFTQMAHFPNHVLELFQGERVLSTNLPFYYVPTWISITTPPVTLLLGIVGVVSIVGRGVTRPGDILRNTPLRFEFLLIACFILPILAVVLLHSVLYGGWHHMYFLYAPVCLVAVFGLHWLISWKPLRTGIYALAGMGVVMMLAAIISLHPLQQVYFNFLMDRTTPEYLRSQYSMSYYGDGSLKTLEYLLKRYPSSPIYIAGNSRHMVDTRLLLPEADRQRTFLGVGLDGPNFSIRGSAPTGMEGIFDFQTIYTKKVYNNTILQAMRLDLSGRGEAMADARRKMYRSTVLEEPVFSSNFDIYFNDKDKPTLTYIKESCRADDTVPVFLLHVFPENPNDLPDEFKQYGYGSYDFFFYRMNGVIFDGKCMVTVNLPEYAISRIRTGQYLSDYTQRIVWRENFPLSR